MRGPDRLGNFAPPTPVPLAMNTYVLLVIMLAAGFVRRRGARTQ